MKKKQTDTQILHTSSALPYITQYTSKYLTNLMYTLRKKFQRGGTSASTEVLAEYGQFKSV